jgi:hypothetical protein
MASAAAAGTRCADGNLGRCPFVPRRRFESALPQGRWRKEKMMFLPIILCYCYNIPIYYMGYISYNINVTSYNE